MTSLHMCKHKSMPNVCRIAKFQRLYYDLPSVMGEHFINSWRVSVHHSKRANLTLKIASETL